MRASIVAGLLAAGSAHAFSDSSPFLIFSTAPLPTDPTISQMETSASVYSFANAILADCPTSNYLLVAQPNVHASDLYAPPFCEAHRLRRALASKRVNGRFLVSEVVARNGETNMTLDYFATRIHAACAAKNTGGSFPHVNQLALPALPVAPTCQDRAEAMGDNEYILGNALDDALALGDVTVVYFSTGKVVADGGHAATPGDDGDAQATLRKRMAAPQMVRQVAAPSKDRDTRGLFEKYQFFTPGIFMSLIVFFIILSILYVGLSAVSSLQVPYGAFDKEMGPAAQKKQQ
ncbi:hypothetical protein SEPCBS57363_006412 [Sporothrix epigloea]|uniref:Protein BIG1 n=1 Tax=Sporothrix epigloea TaxID=1892477 RepID=A0ABP0E2W6_9PEZI